MAKAKRRDKQGKKTIQVDFSPAHKLVWAIQELETAAHRIGMTKTAQALNTAKNTCGWELAEHIEAYMIKI